MEYMTMSAPYQGQLKFELLQEALRGELLSPACVESGSRRSDRYKLTPSSGNEAPAARKLDFGKTEGSGYISLEDCATLGSYIASFGIVGRSSMSAAEQAVTSHLDSAEQRHDDVSAGSGRVTSEVATEGGVSGIMRKRGRGSAKFRPLSEEERAAWFDQMVCRDMDDDVDCGACIAPRGSISADGASSVDELCARVSNSEHRFVPMPPLVEDSLEGVECSVVSEECSGGPDETGRAGSVAELEVGESCGCSGGPVELSGTDSEDEPEMGECGESLEEVMEDGRVYDLPVVLTTVKARIHAKEAHNQGPPPVRRRCGKHGPRW